MAENVIPEITPAELKRMMDERRPLVLVDVREPDEHRLGSIPGARLIPLGDLPKRLHELKCSDNIVLYCQSGKRSALAAKMLLGGGFGRLWSLKGGILAWAEPVGPAAMS